MGKAVFYVYSEEHTGTATENSTNLVENMDEFFPRLFPFNNKITWPLEQISAKEAHEIGNLAGQFDEQRELEIEMP